MRINNKGGINIQGTCKKPTPIEKTHFTQKTHLKSGALMKINGILQDYEGSEGNLGFSFCFLPPLFVWYIVVFVCFFLSDLFLFSTLPL